MVDQKQYADFIDGWCRGGCSYRVRSRNWSEIETFIIENLNAGNPVIALGSMDGYAHYFSIVG